MVANKETSLYTLINKNGMRVDLTNYGARAIAIVVPDNMGNPVDVILGYDNISGYLSSNDYYSGATVGRYANRISGGKFTLNGIEYILAINDTCGPNNLHGGISGFSHKVWSTRIIDDNGIEFSYRSADLEEGFPGNLDVLVTYRLTEDNELKIDYGSVTDKPTVCNLTHHSYFNLHGAGEGTILDHVLQIMADQYTPIDEAQLPTSGNIPVRGTPFDFNTPCAIGSRLKTGHQQLIIGNGYNHNFVLNDHENNQPIAVVWSPVTGIKMEMFTDEPGVQFYSCGLLERKNLGKRGGKYINNGAFCLEAQHYPDSPNHPAFPSTRLDPGKRYTQSTSYRFSIK
jgi:aldose 1-epimerase